MALDIGVADPRILQSANPLGAKPVGPEDIALMQERMAKAQETRQKLIEEAQDNAAVKAAWSTHAGPDGPDYHGILTDLSRSSPRAAMKFQEFWTKQQESAAKQQTDEWKAQDAEAEGITRLFQGVESSPDPTAAYQAARNILTAYKPAAAKMVPEQYDPTVVGRLIAHGTSVAEFNKKDQQAFERTMGKGTTEQGIGETLALTTSPEDFKNRIARLQMYVPKDLLAPYVALGPTTEMKALAQRAALGTKEQAVLEGQAATRANMLANTAADNARADAAAARMEQHQGVQEGLARANLAVSQGHLALDKQKLAQDATAAATDKTYNVNKNRLDNLRKPLAETAARMSRLVETVNQATPQADALVAPELLTVMAGGMGSGLRMNEAEIARIVGGRSNVEGIKAALNKWQTDPSKALSITAAQRQQIRALIQAVGTKSDAKMQVIQNADNDLLDAKTVDDQRRIIVKAQKDVEDITGTSGGASGVKEGTQKPITLPGYPPGAMQEYRGGKWVRIK